MEWYYLVRLINKVVVVFLIINFDFAIVLLHFVSLVGQPTLLIRLVA